MTPTQEQIIAELIAGNKSNTLIELIDTLPNSERIEIRTVCLAQGVNELPRNLYYNYKTQSWID